MIIQRFEKRLKLKEGLSLRPYLDSLGIWTIGYGVTSWLGSKVDIHWQPITIEEATVMMHHHMIVAIGDAQMFINNWSDLTDVRQEVLAEMAYQLGGPKQRRFKRLKHFIELKLWEKAAHEMLDSKWSKQTPRRCYELARMMRLGIHDFDKAG